MSGRGPPIDAMAAAQGVVVLVDYQARLMPAIHDGAAAVRSACALADAARLLGVPVVGTEQNPAGLGPNVAAIAERCDRMLPKLAFDATADGLLADLEARGPRSQVVLAGCEAHVCLLQTGLGLLRANRRVFVVEEACGSRREPDKRRAMARLAAAGATIVSFEMVVFEWLARSDVPAFRRVLAIVKAQDAL